MVLGEEESVLFRGVLISGVEKYTNMVLGEEGVIISGVEKYTNMVLGEEESVLFREVPLFQGCPYRGVPL